MFEMICADLEHKMRGYGVRPQDQIPNTACLAIIGFIYTAKATSDRVWLSAIAMPFYSRQTVSPYLKFPVAT